MAFKDINPQAPLHVLIVPRRHIATLNDLTPDDDALVGSMFRTRRGAGEAARLLRARVPDGLQHAIATQGRRCSTSTCTCSRAAGWPGRRDRSPKAEQQRGQLRSGLESRRRLPGWRARCRGIAAPGCRASRRVARLRCRAARLSPTITDSDGRHAQQLQRRLEDARMRLQVAVLGRRQRAGDQPVQLEVLLERRQAAVRVRDQPDLDAAGGQLSQHRRDVVVEEEVLAGRPLRRRSRARRRRGAAPVRPSPR